MRISVTEANKMDYDNSSQTQVNFDKIYEITESLNLRQEYTHELKPLFKESNVEESVIGDLAGRVAKIHQEYGSDAAKLALKITHTEIDNNLPVTLYNGLTVPEGSIDAITTTELLNKVPESTLNELSDAHYMLANTYGVNLDKVSVAGIKNQYVEDGGNLETIETAIDKDELTPNPYAYLNHLSEYNGVTIPLPELETNYELPVFTTPQSQNEADKLVVELANHINQMNQLTAKRFI